MRKIVKLDFDSIIEAVQKLAHELPPNAVLYGIPRNGMIIAGMLAHYRVPVLDLLKCPPDMLQIPPENLIIVDDIADTGKTLENAKRVEIRNWTFKTAVLYWRSTTSVHRPDYYAYEITHNDYLQFPWELDEEAKKKVLTL